MPNLIGTAPDQVPVNGFLGNMAFQNKEGVVTDLLSTTALTVTGNVGIGTASPNNKLQVNGANVGIRISDTSGTTDFHEIQSGGVNGQNLFIDADRNNLSGNMIFRVAGATERMRIDSAGNVGINQPPNASQGRVQINQPLGSSADGALRLTDNATTSFIFNNISNGLSALWSSGALAFGTAGNTFTERMRITSAGSVGIGTSSPPAQQTLTAGRNMTGSTFSSGVASTGQVQSDATSRADYFISVSSVAAGTYSRVVGYQAQQGTITGTVNNQYGFQADATLIGATYNMGFFGNIPDGTNRWNFYAQGTAPNYFAGKVGIGTTVPSFSLQVVSATNANPIALIAGPTRAVRFGTDTNGGFVEGVDNTGTASYQSLTIGGLDLRVNTNNAERMRIDSNGNVGIGTSSIGAKLEVQTTGAYSAYFQTGADQSGNVALRRISLTAINFRAAIQGQVLSGTWGADDLLINPSGGNVGIGTSSPAVSALLDVQSTTKGLRLPNMTTTQKNAISSPAAGLMVFDTTLAKACLYTGSAWQTITSV